MPKTRWQALAVFSWEAWPCETEKNLDRISSKESLDKGHRGDGGDSLNAEKQRRAEQGSQ